MFPVRPALAVAALVGALAGCGDKPLSAGEYRSRAVAICAAEKARSKQVAEPRTPADVPTFVAQGLTLVRPAVAKLGDLRPPDALKADHDRVIDLLRRELALIQGADAKLRARAEPLATFASLEPRLRPLMSAEDGRWRALGLPQCLHQ